MKLDIETILEVGGADDVAWGMTPQGNAVLQVRVGGRKVRLEVTADEAKDIGCAAIYASITVANMKPARPAFEVTVDPRNGRPA